MSLRPARPSPIRPGYRLDHYEFLCPIAEGGMASVWLARLQRKHGFERLVAIKTILPHFACDLSFQHMFLDEARISSRIHHPNVAQILDLGDEQDVLYLVMEWVDGDSLSKLLRAAKSQGTELPCGVVLRILADACAGLGAAHALRGKDGVSLGVVHRDVSPQNILVTTKGVAKVIDFGIAKARDRVAGETSSGSFKGKVHYMAPEQAMGQPVDGRADVWAIGAVIYHALSGRPPFDAENPVATLSMLAMRKPPEPLPASVPEPVRALVAKALAHEVTERYASMAELQIAIEQVMIVAGIATSVADVEAFTTKHFGELAQARDEAVNGALTAASQRPPKGPGAADDSDPMRVTRAEGPVIPRALSPPGLAPDGSPFVVGALQQPAAERSSATLGAAASVSSSTLPTAERGKWPRRAAVAATLLAVVTGVAVMGRSGPSGSSAAGGGKPVASITTLAPSAPSTLVATAELAPSAAAASEPEVVPEPTAAAPTATATSAPSSHPPTPRTPSVARPPQPKARPEASPTRRRADYGF